MTMRPKLDIVGAVFLLAAAASMGCGGNPPAVLVSVVGWTDSISEMAIRPTAAGTLGRTIHVGKHEQKFGIDLPEDFHGSLDLSVESWESEPCLVVTGETTVVLNENSPKPLRVAMQLSVNTCTSL